MNITPEQLLEYRSKAEELKAKYVKATGALETLAETCKIDFNADSMADMNNIIADLKIKLDEACKKEDALVKELQELLTHTSGVC